MAGSVIGWDIGGAHLKAARLEDGRVADVVQVPSPLWLGVECLEQAFSAATTRLGRADRHAATMTGELADVFANRIAGVAAITEMLISAVRPAPAAIYGGRVGFLDPADASAHAADIASANWHASATLTARFVPDALFVDIGSTTTDIVPIAGARVRAAGYTDAERLACGELVYTGLTRSFLMSLCARAPVGGAWVTLACEHFATSADVYRLLGELTEDADQLPAADGRDKSVAASQARLARMVGHDAAERPAADWRNLAAWFAEAQLRLMIDGAMQVLSRIHLAGAAPVVGAGVGRHLAMRLAHRLGGEFRDFGALIEAAGAAGDWASYCAPAVSVALLAS
jgi:probable H4MPT-linked C1 transfer pathway protein